MQAGLLAKREKFEQREQHDQRRDNRDHEVGAHQTMRDHSGNQDSGGEDAVAVMFYRSGG